ncbi:MAG: glycerophosphodiester phosphodiesterase [Eubacterium sp.]|nr:glycerophosphodiester phosphodiesterase [Eubacterium sp.]
MITRITAHRGASYLAKHENTLESFQLAIDLKADKVEFDVRRTSDRKLVIFHDSTFFDQPISYQTYREMQQHAAEEGYRIPLFEEVVKLCAGRIYMDIEIKEAGYEQELIDILHRYYKYTDYSIKSFEDPAVYHVKKLDPQITTGLLLGKDRRDVGYLLFRFKEIFPVRRLRQAGCDFVSPYHFYATPFFIFRMHRHHYPVQVWTVNKEKHVRKFLKRGVDEIITDKPDMGLVVRRKYYRSRKK